MPLAVYTEGTATINSTEFSFASESTTLATKTDAGVYALVFDANAIVAGDQFLVQLYEAGKTAGTKRLVESWIVEGKTGKPLMYLPSTGGFILGNGWDITIKKLAGTDRSIDYTVWRVS
jgi:hypothetical protein